MAHEEHKQLLELPCTLGILENTFGVIQSESMDLQNDPRFFQGNILNKRLAAFGQLSVVSSLMVAASSHIIEMKKEFNFVTVEGWMRVISFVLMSLVLILNVFAVYVGMAQTYHTYRLETAGPTGFEIATSYYLNRNIVSWRHISVKCLLSGLTLYLFSTGIRCAMSFDLDDPNNFPKMSHINSRIFAFVILGLFLLSAWGMHVVHQTHVAVFKVNYEWAKTTERPYVGKVNELMSPSRRGRLPGRPDV